MVRKLWSGNSEVLDVMYQKFTEVGEESQLQMAMMVRMESMVREVFAELETVKNSVMDIATSVVDLKDTNHIGKKSVILSALTTEVSAMTVEEIRQAINRAANRQQKGYMRIYSKLCDITGVDIYAIGKVKIGADDGLGFTNGGESYINTIFKEGVQMEAAAIALDIIRNK